MFYTAVYIIVDQKNVPGRCYIPIKNRVIKCFVRAWKLFEKAIKVLRLFFLIPKEFTHLLNLSTRK